MAKKVYEVLKGTIYGVPAGSNIELEEKEAKAWGKRYVAPAKKATAKAKKEETKGTPEKATNKAVQGEDADNK